MTIPSSLADLWSELVGVCLQFRQVILSGPPGTGKTRLAKRAALKLLCSDLVDKKEFKCISKKPDGELCGETIKFTELEYGLEKPCRCGHKYQLPIHVGPHTSEHAIEKGLNSYQQVGRFGLVVFHPSYEYEQFVGGIVPIPTDGQGLRYQVKPGIFLELCSQASQQPPVVLIIDEINRGNLPKLLGELVYGLEYRGAAVRLPFEYQDNSTSKEPAKSSLTIPENLYIIATMNSSDRSIGHIDAAVRRRFGLLPVAPDEHVIRQFWADRKAESRGKKLAELMTALNKDLRDASHGEELLVGHSYFLADASNCAQDLLWQVRNKWRYQVQQLLREYSQVVHLSDEFFRKYLPDHLDKLA